MNQIQSDRLAQPAHLVTTLDVFGGPGSIAGKQHLHQGFNGIHPGTGKILGNDQEIPGMGR